MTARALPPDDDGAGQVEPLGPGWLTVTAIIGVMAALIALGGMVLSFRAVSAEMIPAFGARWAWLVPIVVDLTVFVFSGVDLVLARLDMGHPLARWTVYGATGGTVWLNYSAGGSAAGRVAHVLMPSIWVVFIELMRHVVRRQVNLSTASHREAIPTARWMLSPWPTLKLWRRMVLWRVNSYPRALEQEKMRLGAVATAREMHGRLWRYKISPLIRLQINLGEVGAFDLRPAPEPAPVSVPAQLPIVPVAAPVAYAPGVHPSESVPGAGAYAVVPEPVMAHVPSTAANGYAAAQAPQDAAHLAAEVAMHPAADAGLVSGDALTASNGASGPGHAAAAYAADQAGRAPGAPRPAGRGPSPSPRAGTHAAPGAFAGPRPAPAPGEAPPGPAAAAQAPGPRSPQHAPGGPSEAIPGVAAAGAAAAHAARSLPVPAAAPGSGAQLPAQRVPAAAPVLPASPADPRAVPGQPARADAPHVEFQAPPPMPPMPRRSTRESELLTAAREVERWRGMPSATRISRELGIGMPLATSLANALRDEDGPGADDPAL
jgi:hypothetical protein